MTLLGRLIGRDPPRIPAGGRAFASQDDVYGARWSVRVQMPGEELTSACRRIGPSFTLQMTAEAYLAWVTGEADSFSYPAGVA